MLDRNLIAKNMSTVKAHLEHRHASSEMKQDLEKLSVVIERRRQLQQETDLLRSERKKKSKAIGALMKSGKRDEAEGAKAEVRGIGDRLDILETERKNLEAQEEELLLSLPNLIDERVPRGNSDKDNEIIEIDVTSSEEVIFKISLTGFG